MPRALLICAVAALLSVVVSARQPNAAPKKLPFLTHARLYKHTSLDPAELAVTEWASAAAST